MQLSVRDVARLLKVPEDTVYKWVGDEVIPAQRINSQYYFNKSELLEWAALRGIAVSPEIFSPGATGNGPLPTVTAALLAGGVHPSVDGPSRDETLRNVVKLLGLPGGFDRESLVELLIVREQHGSTGVGDGIAIPHPRAPIVAAVDEPQIALCYLTNPVPFGAADGQPVHIVFLLLAPNVRTHLHLLARLACLLRDDDFRAAVLQKQGPAEIIATARRFESSAS